MSRKAAVKRKTNEVEVMIDLNIDGKGIYEINTGIPFFDHMLEQLSKHGFFDLRIIANGDTEIDFHHTVEDVGICLGEAFESALGDKKSINRYGHFSVPFDETLSTKEDRYWVNSLIESGMKSFYDSNTICHHHYTDNGATWKGIG